MPLSLFVVWGHDGVVTLLLIDSTRPSQLMVRPNRRWVRLLVRVLASMLDRQLAQGRSPEDNRFLAARAEELVAAATRQELSQDWAHLLVMARTPPPAAGRRVPLNRDAIIAYQAEIDEMLELLGDPLSPPARGVALASWVLRDGTGPLYSGLGDLGHLLRQLKAQLDPAISLCVRSTSPSR